MDFKALANQLIKTIQKYHHILVPIKGSPDPDAMASAYIFKLIGEAYGVKVTIDSPNHPSLTQNRLIVKDLHLPIQFEEITKNIKSYDSYAIIDHQSIYVEGLTGVIPCAIHIDHHERADEDFPVEFRIVLDEVGSTATLMIFLLEELQEQVGLTREERIKTATALYYGIKTDTSDFQYALPLDLKARDIIEPDVDLSFIKQISSLPFSREAMIILNRAIQNQVIHQEWLVSGIGYIKKRVRDMMAITADFLLKREEINQAVVFAIVKDEQKLTLEVCLRTKRPKVNLNRLIKKVTQMGGARKFKGAYQVNLDYFRFCPEPDFLWQMVYLTTMDALKEHTNHWRMGSAGFMDIIQKPFSKLRRMFSGKRSNDSSQS